MPDETRTSGRTAFIRTLTEAGLDDVLVLTTETAETVLTEKRMELVEEIATDDVESIRDLSRRLDRDVSIVSRDLDILFEVGVVAFEADGRAKRPVLAHETILVQPLVFDGEVIPRSDGTEYELQA